tara:strand:+ start:217 stop:444 length:228 start_codon:yes stop_codon:yes gene_type:complete
MSYDVTYDEYKKRLKLKNEIVKTLREAKTKLLYSQAKAYQELPAIENPTEILETIAKIESLINKINLDNDDKGVA